MGAIRAVLRSGAARIVSRRYIAEFVSREHRTRASAAFVSSSALGMGLGPLLARLFEWFPEFRVGPVMLSSITMAGCAILPHFPSTLTQLSLYHHEQSLGSSCINRQMSKVTLPTGYPSDYQ